MESESKHSLPGLASHSCVVIGKEGLHNGEMAKPPEASDPATLGALIRDARKRLRVTQEQVAKVAGVSRAAVGQWEAGETNPSTENFAKVCNFLGLPIPSALRSLIERRIEDKIGPLVDFPIGERAAAIEREIIPVVEAEIPKQLRLKDVPVFGMVAGGKDGEFYQNGEVVDYVRRPPGALASKDVYALYVMGTSMSPRFEEGELVYVSPHRPPSVGEYAVIELFPKEGDRVGAGYIKRFSKRSLQSLEFQQLNPRKTLRIPIERIKNLHRVIPWNELLGL